MKDITLETAMRRIRPDIKRDEKEFAIMITCKSMTLFLWILFIGHFSYAQKDTVNTKYLSIGTKTAGICFGHSSKYHGLRFNIWDRDLEIDEKISRRINGVNVSFAAISEQTNGVQIGGLACQTNRMNGLSVAGIAQSAVKINGLAASFGISSDTLNGVFLGFMISPANRNIDNRVINGVAIGVIVGAEKINGLAIGLFNSFSKKQNGMAISSLNKTEELHGLQIGLLNYAGNNPRLLRWLPLINFHL